MSYYSEQKITYVKTVSPNGSIKFKEVVSVEYADANNRRITENMAVYNERCSWSEAFEGVSGSGLYKQK